MTTAQIIERAGRLLADAAPRRSKVILFGSHAREEAAIDSDFDFLVIESEVPSRVEETVRLRDALDPLEIAADVIVMSSDHVKEWGSVPGTMLHAALTEGRVLAET
jgi:predicted nucleotidyltransferase